MTITPAGCPHRLQCWAWISLWLLAAPAPAAESVTSYALINDDASLTLRNRVYHLHGIYLPPTNRHCEGRFLPVRCASRAVLALQFKISGFVTCRTVDHFSDGSRSAYCSTRDIDLGGYLIEQGWAVAGPDAAFEYEVLERIAHERGMGVWGFHSEP